jgi:hypothetical protein
MGLEPGNRTARYRAGTTIRTHARQFMPAASNLHQRGLLPEVPSSGYRHEIAVADALTVAAASVPISGALLC